MLSLRGSSRNLLLFKALCYLCLTEATFSFRVAHVYIDSSFCRGIVRLTWPDVVMGTELC